MLANLAKLQNCSVSLTTNTNGQINLAIMRTGAGKPLIMTFSESEIGLAETEIAEYCNHSSKVQVTSNLESAKKGVNPTPTKAKGNAASKGKPEADIPEEANEDMESDTNEDSDSSDSFEDALLSEFGL